MIFSLYTKHNKINEKVKYLKNDVRDQKPTLMPR